MEFFNLFVEKFLNNITPFISFIALFVFDLILGISKGIKFKNFSSGKLRASVPKFGAYVFIILSCIIFDIILKYGTDIEYLQGHAPISNVVTISVCLIEFISIIENSKKLGVDIPDFLIKIITELKSKLFNK
jgi:toxin secretion/phage lysis holin